jgi:predicted ferric reductase
MIEYVDSFAIPCSLQAAMLAGVLLLLHPSPKLLPGWSFRLLAGAIVVSLLVLFTMRTLIPPAWLVLASFGACLTWIVLSLILVADTTLRIWYRLRPAGI